MSIRGVILDMDGTLIDSNDAHALAWQIALRNAGVELPFAEVRQAIGMGSDNLLPAVAAIEKDTPQGEAIAEERRKIFKERFANHLQPFPEVRLLIERMKNDGMRIVVASSAEGSEVDHLLKLADIADLVESTTSSDDADRSKPEPDIIQVALEKLGYQPNEVLMVGDTPYDIEAAQKTGVAVVALRCGGFSDDQLSGALAIYDSPAALIREYDTSPFIQ